MIDKQIVIDAEGGVVGRIASNAAKQALLGKTVIILNCEKAILTGRRGNVVEEYSLARRRGGTSLKGPFYPKSPERIVKRAVRGMLDYTHRRGLDALKRVKCFIGIPSEYVQSKKIKFVKEMNTSSINLSDLEKVI